MEEEAKKLKNYPYLMVLESAEAINFVVMVEREAFVETETFNSALLYLFAAYYVFNIAYPKGCYSVFIFFTKVCSGCWFRRQTVPKSVCEIVTVMRRF